MEPLYSLAESITRFMDSGPGLPVTLLYLVIAGIPVTLLHELGHAIAAHRLLGSEVEVSIGTVGTAWLLGQTSPGVLHDVLWTATLAGAFAVLNLIPITLQERRNGPTVRTDGRLALDALRVTRALR